MRIPQALKQAYSQGYPESAMHVQESIGSRNSAIHNDYHTSLRPSSMLEPRYPSLKVVMCKTLTRRFAVTKDSMYRNGSETQWQQEQAQDTAELWCQACPATRELPDEGSGEQRAAPTISTQSLTREVHID